MRRRITRGRALTAAAATAATAAVLAVTACAAPAATPAPSTPAAAPAEAALPLATSLVTAGGSWALVPMASDPAFWQVLARPGPASAWKLDTPPGVASNGGLVAAAEPDGGLTVAVRPSEDLEFTPLAATTAGGTRWTTPPPLQAGIADSPDTLTASGRVLAAVTGHGVVEASTDGGAAWRTLPSPAPRECGAVTVTSVSLTGGTGLLAGGACGPDGTAVVLSGSLTAPSPGWRAVSLPASGQLLRFAGDKALLRNSAGLSALWDKQGKGWTASAPLPVTETPASSGWLASSGAWVLLPGGTAAVITGPGASWRTLPRAPARTSVLASGPGGAIDALAASGSALTVWRLGPSASRWIRVQSMNVPIQYGSSS
ncbi:MAG TPA: hypothetical protein VGG75_18365 [Trebonia sp.]